MLHGCPPSPDAWGRLNVVTPFHHLSGDSHINSSLREGPLRHLAQHAVDQTRLFSTRCAQAINASGSNRTAVRIAAAPTAISNAVIPSIRPVERFFESFRFPAASRSTTQLLAHHVSIGCAPCLSFFSRMKLSRSRNAGDIDR